MTATKRVWAVVVCVSVLALGLAGYSVIVVTTLDDRVSALETTTDDTTTVRPVTPTNATVSVATGSMLAYDDVTRTGATFQYTFVAIPGTDTVSVDTTNVALEPEFQQSITDARTAVTKLDYNTAATGVHISFTTPDHWEVVSGRSAGLVVAAELAATDPRYELNDSVALTGDVQSDGSLARVGHVGAKAAVAAQHDKHLLVTPPTRVPVTTSEQITVRQVTTLSDALAIALTQTREHDAENTTQPSTG